MRLEAMGLAFGYGRRTVGSNVSLAVEPGEVLVLLGPNGSGKTTLFKTLLGLLPPLAGSIALGGADIVALPRAEVAKRIAYVPQAHAAFFPYTVRDVVLMGRTAHMGIFAAPSAADRDAAEQGISALGIGHLADRIYTEVSGGERQLALIARALAQGSPILVMDEPTASLDFGNQVKVLSKVAELAGQGRAVVLSTHDPAHAFLVGHRVALLRDGGIAAVGPPEEVVTEAALGGLYGVEVAVRPLPGDGTAVLPRF